MNRDDERDLRPVSGIGVGRDVDVSAVPTDADESLETAEIRADIEQTRADMSETINALQERLSPSNLKEQAQEQISEVKEQVKEQVREQFHEAKEMVRAATIGRVEDMVQSAGDSVNDARYTVMETIRQNPIPAALVGIGLGWLFMNRRSATPIRYSGRGNVRGVSQYYDDRRPYDYAPGYSSGGMRGQSQGFVGNAVDRVQQTAGDVAGSVTGTASNVAGTVSDTASNVASTVSDTASNLADQAQYQAQRLEDRFQQQLGENPLVVGAVALALGAALGLAVPTTEKEDQLMGEARDTLFERATEAAAQTAAQGMDKVQQAAGQVASASEGTAQTMGKIQQAAGQVADKARDTAREAGQS